MKNDHIAVLDIGKTNKKILIYSSKLQLLDEQITQIPEIESNGIICDDVEALKIWILDTLRVLASTFRIGVIATTAHGATYALLDGQMQHVMPQIAYTHDPGDSLHTSFYKFCGTPHELQKVTATPNFNLLINPAKSIFYARQQYPEAFQKARHLVFYAQFFGCWLTGKVCTDPTYAGNHTYLWDFEKGDWSAVADRLGIRHLLPKNMCNPWDSLGQIKPEIADVTGLSPESIVIAGIHDSNASMLPYLLMMKEPFLLNSTGTWCVIMTEKERVYFNPDELGKVVFYNLNAFRKPVKTAIFLGGLEFEYYTNILKKMHQRSNFPVFDESVYQKVINERDKFILPGVAKGIGQFPDSSARVLEKGIVFSKEEIETGRNYPGFFQNYEEALAVLNLSLAVQTKVSLDRVGMLPGMQVFTEGGFAKNDAYNKLMTAFFPGSSFYLTNLEQATAFGAAMCGKAAMDQIDIRSLRHAVELEKKPVNPTKIHGLDGYFEKFIDMV
jgi:L-fuculokinase